MRRAQLVDGSYVDIVERDGGWTYNVIPSTPRGQPHGTGEVPDIYGLAVEAEAAAKNRFEAELATDFFDVE